MKSCFVQDSGNTVLKNVPADYFPPGREKWFVIPDGDDAGKKLFFYDVTYGEGNPEVVLLFVHGNPESSYTYRKIRSGLEQLSGRPYRLVMMDHIGFGLSDQADFEMVDMHHAANLIQLVTALDLRNITLIVHDWGGPIGIGALLREPERVSNLVLLNTMVFPMPPDGPTYENYPVPVKALSWSGYPDLVPNRFWGAHAAFAVFTPPRNPVSLLGHYFIYQLRVMLNMLPEPDRTAQNVFINQFKSRMNALSSKRMVRQTPVWGHGYTYHDKIRGKQDNHDFYRFIQETITPAWGPAGQNIGARALFGAWDPLAKDSILARWRTALPQLEGHIRLFEMVSHFVEEHKPLEIAREIAGVAGLV
jgi:pimeloyl-ACP methyl ester carboxylesterase